MIIAIISDVHDNLANLQKVISYLKKHPVDGLICLGDLQTLEAWQLLNKLNLPIWAVLGNSDQGIPWKKLLSTVSNIKLAKDIQEIDLGGQKILFSHEPETVKKIIKAAPKKYSLALHGHTHYPWEENILGTKILNPGNVANVFYSPTFALVNLKTLKAKLILINELK